MRFQIITTDEDKAEREAIRSEQRKVFESGKLRIDWSQMRGGYAIFVSGRMEGELFDNEDDAKEWLLDEFGIEA